MEIRLDGALVTTTMRTPGHDFELAVGFLHAEGLLGDATVTEIRYCSTGSAVETEFNVVEVSTGRPPPERTRLATTTAACGLCGAEAIDALVERLDPLSPVEVDSTVLTAVPAAVRAKQELFDKTGSVHAAAAFDLVTGEAALVREDIGRHNAVDKVVGRLRLDGALPASAHGLFVSGRASFEMVQKAWAAGFGVVLAVSGPSSLAVETARRANVALYGFVRGESLNCYSPAPR